MKETTFRLAICACLAWGGGLSVHAAELAAAEDLKGFKVSDGLVLSVAVAEPHVAQPVYLTFDERGRMWVVQYLQYPFPAGLKVVGHDEYWRVKYDHWPPPPPPRHVVGADKVTIFEDRDGDGQFEAQKDFVTGLNITTAALPGRDGVWVMNPPYLLFYPDANRDDQPDGDPVVHLEGFGLEDMHAVANSLTWGPDGWLYGCQGSTCTATVRRPGRDEGGPGLHFKGQCIWRYEPTSRRFELFAEGGYNNFGLAPDRQWRLFTGSNGGIIGVHYVPGGYYRKNWGKHGPFTNPYAFGHLEGMADQSSQAKLSQAMIFCTADGWPAEYRDGMLVARVLQQRIDLCRLKPAGSTYSAQELRPILSTKDRHFRPVDLKFGPDGALYIADWHEPNVTWNVTAGGTGLLKASGRIYRLAPAALRPLPPTDLSALPAERLMAMVSDGNPWRRETALRLLRERPERVRPQPLAAQVTLNPGPSPRRSAVAAGGRESFGHAGGPGALDALWALHASGGFSPEFALGQLEHPAAAVRSWVIRLLGEGAPVEEPLARKLAALAGTETNAQVRSQLASTARHMPARHALPIVEVLAQRREDLGDAHIPLLVWWIIEEKLRGERAETLRWLDNSSLWQGPLFSNAVIARLGQRFVTDRTDEDLRLCARLLALAPGTNETREFLRGMALGLAGNKVERIPPELDSRFQELWHQAPPDAATLAVAIRLGSVEAVPRALQAVIDDDTPEKERISLLRLLAERREEKLVGTVLRWLRREPSPILKAEALSAAQYFSDPRIARVLIDEVPGLSPVLRDRALATLSSRRSWALQLLEAVDRRPFNRALVPAEIVLALEEAGGPAAQRYIRKHWGTIRPTSQEKQERMAQMRAQLASGAGDAAGGKPLFEQACSRCHTLFGQGRQVGPDLTGLDRNNTEELLRSIVDPSAVVVPEFLAMQFTLKPAGDEEEERIITGFLLSEDLNQLTLADTAGTRMTVARQELLHRQALTLSIMPEGLLDGLGAQQVRDLFAYLQSKP